MSDVSDLISHPSSWANGSVDLGSLIDEWALRVWAHSRPANPGSLGDLTSVLEFLGSLKIRDAIQVALDQAPSPNGLALLQAIDQLFCEVTSEVPETTIGDISNEPNSGFWWWKRIPIDETFGREYQVWRARLQR